MSNKGAGISGAFFIGSDVAGGSADPGYSERGGHSVLARTGVALKSGDAADLTTRHLLIGFYNPCRTIGPQLGSGRRLVLMQVAALLRGAE